jgi:hypothetical protein
MNHAEWVHIDMRKYTMKNKNAGAIRRAKKKHAKNVARKGKGAQYGASVKSFSKIKQLTPKQQEYAIAGVTSMDSKSDHESATTFTDADTKTITIS